VMRVLRRDSAKFRRLAERHTEAEVGLVRILLDVIGGSFLHDRLS
jgi:hypothetical protein